MPRAMKNKYRQHIYSMQPALYSILYVSHTYIHISKKVRSAVFSK